MFSEISSKPERHTVIHCSDLGKRYKIYNRPSDRLKQALWQGRKQYFREFWALRNISLKINRGESLGIIGRNGSGKSTLLQLICGTLTPTTGKIHREGRIAALLELGSGFNPEFSGIENVYLNASLLGLTREETNDKLDDILAFADIGDFISQPVKTYSSGMAIRLAFAIATNVNANILIVDEALSVGDQPFQQKCFDRLRKFKDNGGTAILVSHDNSSIKRFCERAIWLKDGSVIENDLATIVADKYKDWCDDIYDVTYSGPAKSITISSGDSQIPCHNPLGQNQLFKNKLISIYSLGLQSETVRNTSTATQLSKCKLEFRIANEGISQKALLRLGFWLRDQRSLEICGSNTVRCLPSLQFPEAGSSTIVQFAFDLPPLQPGYFSIRFNADIKYTESQFASDWVTLVLLDSCLPFIVHEAEDLKDLPCGVIGLPCKSSLVES